MKYHTRRQWEVIYEKLEQQFYYDPPLRPKTMEIYLIEHFKFMRATWKSQRVAKGESAQLDNCPKECWKASMTYWKTPTTIMESSHMIEVQTMVRNPIALGRMSLG